MKKYLSMIALTALAFAGLAQAHTHLHKSEPANNSTVSMAPKNLLLQFSGAVQLTALSLQKGDGATQDLAPLPKEAAKQITVPMPAALDAGQYIVKWRAVGEDKHVMSGKVTFTVAK